MFCAPSVVFYQCAQYNRSKRRRTTISLTNTLASVCIFKQFNDYLDQRFFAREKSRILSVKRYSLIVIVITRSRYPISALETKCPRLHHLFFAHAHTHLHIVRAYALKGQQTYLNGGATTTTTNARTHLHIEILEVKE